jgi:asparagine synthase (glutamine-hydrolysing)
MGVLGAEPVARYDGWMSIFTRAELDGLYTPEHSELIADARSADGLIEQAWNSSSASTVVEKMLDVDVETYLPGDLLVKMDVATMAHSLEVRSPLLDHVLMEQVAGVPSQFKLRPGVPKLLLKEAVRPWLPDAVIDREKMGFGVPLASWFRGSLRQLPETILLDPVAVDRGIFRPDRVRRLIDQHLSGTRDNASRIWALIQLELWFRTYIDQLSLVPLSLHLSTTAA